MKVYNSIIPVKGFISMVILFFIFIRKEYKGTTRVSKYLINHERIHCIQQIEIWVTSIAVALLFCLLTDLSYWWMLATPVIPLLIYWICWMVEIALPPYNMAYKNICFETEAVYNEHDLEYIKRRKLFQFRFLKYISNKKYPALTEYEKMKRRRQFKK